MKSNISKKLPLFDNLRQKMTRMPQMKTENSLILRILVQALVIVGIIATDIAAQTQMSFWAIPLSIIGGIWSWYRRKHRNITLKFFLAIAMLGILAVFLVHLAQNLNDSRLALASLLVQLQVLHSFDLPRRKDLGYSMVIGLILLGVAGTISQTISFAPWLLLFLILAIPTLILDYRSRLDLERIDQHFPFPFSSRHSHQKLARYSPVSIKGILLLFFITLVLGLTVFLLIPRFPGYQLQTFPVSSPFDADTQQFNEQNNDIINPGYRQKEPENNVSRSGNGGSPTEGKGELNNTHYYGFNTKINQNLRGNLKPTVVMRVRSQAPGFWKALSFDYYTGQGWEISEDRPLQTITRDPWSYKFYLRPSIYAKTKRVIQSYTAVTELPNIIPSLASAKYLYFPAKELGKDQQENLRSPVGLVPGLTYTVISHVPYRDRSLLQQASSNYSDKIKQTYLQIPVEIKEKVRQKTQELLSKSTTPINSAYEAALFLAQTLKQNYQLQNELPFFEENEDLVEAFLFKYNGGYGDHFSSVLTLMLRSIGIPARLTVGFGQGKFNPLTGFYVVSNTDAYALTEVYFPHLGWYSFDPIPGHELIPPSFEEEQTFGVLKQFWNWIASRLPSPVASFFTLLWTKIIGGFISLLIEIWRFISSSLIGVLIGLLSGVGFALFAWLSWGQIKQLGYRRRLKKLSPMTRLYQEMLAFLNTKGYRKHPAQTPLEYVKVAYQQHPQEKAVIIEEISQAYVSWRYGENLQNIDYLKQQFKALSRSFKA